MSSAASQAVRASRVPPAGDVAVLAAKTGLILLILAGTAVGWYGYVARDDVTIILGAHAFVLFCGMLARADRFDIFELVNVFAGLQFIGWIVGLYLLLQPEVASRVPLVLPIDFQKHQYELAFYPLLATAAFLFGYLAPFPAVRTGKLPVSPLARAKTNGIVGLMVLSVLGFYAYMAVHVGGVYTLVEQLFYVRGLHLTYGTGIVQPLGALGSLLVPFVVVFAFRGNVVRFVGSPYVVLAVVAVGVSLIHNSRGALLGQFFIVVVAAYYLRTVRGRTVAIALAVIAGAIVGMRWVIGGLSSDVAFLMSFAFNQGFATMLETFPGRVGFLHGETILESAVYPLLPRILFPDKPAVYGMEKLWLYAGFNTLEAGSQFATSQLGDLYAQLGVSAILVGMAVFGLLSRAVYNVFTAHRTSPTYVFGYGIFVLLYQGMFQGGIPYVYAFAQSGLILVLLWYLRWQERHGPRPFHHVTN